MRSALTCCTQCWACWGKAKTHTTLAALNKSLNSFVQNKDFDFEQHWEHRALWLEAKHKVLLSQCLHPSEGSRTVAAVTRGASWSSWGAPCCALGVHARCCLWSSSWNCNELNMSTAFNSGPPAHEGCGSIRVSPEEATEVIRGWSTSPELRELGLCSLEKRRLRGRPYSSLLVPKGGCRTAGGTPQGCGGRMGGKWL